MRVFIGMRFAAAAALLLGAAAASAGSASASLSNLHLRLIDLRPDDGIAPSVTLFSPGATGGGISHRDKDSQLLGSSEGSLPSYGATISNVALGGGQGFAQSTSGNIFDLGAPGWSAAAMIALKAPTKDISASLWTQVAFYVSPFTAVEVTAQAGDLQVTPTNPDEAFEASVRLSWTGDAYTDSGVVYVASHGASSFYTIANGHLTASSPAPYSLSATFTNLSDATALTSLAAQISTTGTINLPVPEPQSAALLLAGLFALAVRRRQTR